MRRGPRAAVALLASLVLGCAFAPADAPAPTPAGSPPPRGGTLRIGLVHEPGDREGYPDPHGMPYFSEAFPLARCCLFRTLMSYPGLEVEHGGSAVVPDLAIAPPAVSADGLTWTFRLREGIRYAPPYENREVVARDVVRGLERTGRLAHVVKDEFAIDQARAAADVYRVIEGFSDYADQASPTISGIETPGSHTIVFRLTEPIGDFDRRVALPATSPIPDGAAKGREQNYGGFAVSIGPYRHEPRPDPSQPSWADRPPGEVVLVRNPSWVAATDPVRGAYVDRVEIAAVASVEEGRRRVDAGELDFLFDHPETADEQAGVVERDGSRRRLHSTLLNLSSWMPMNVAVPPFDDPAVRRAVAFAVDRPAVIAAIPPFVGEQLVPARHALPDGATNNLLFAYDPFRAASGSDMTAARREMAASRYDTDADGRCDARACTAIVTLVRPSFAPDGVTSLVDSLDGIGLELDVRVTEGDRFGFYAELEPQRKVALAVWATILNFDVDAGQYAPSWDGDEAGNIGVLQTTMLGASPEALRDWGYEVTEVPSVDAKIDECSPTIGDARFACWAEFDQLLTEGVVPAVFLAQHEATWLVSERVARFHIDQAGGQPAIDQIAIAPE